MAAGPVSAARSPAAMRRTPGMDVQQRALREAVTEYVRLYDPARGGDAGARKRDYMTLVNGYFDLVTDFYEFGWGRSFHFAPRARGEGFRASLSRHERFVAAALGLRPGMTALDVGCGVGGPMMEIARASGAQVLGVNNNAYQVARAQRHVARAGLSGRCTLLQADYMAIPRDDASFDAAYAIEATAHAPDKAAAYAEIARVLIPGAPCALLEWCLTPRYDSGNPDHRRIRAGIEAGSGLPDIASTREVIPALEQAGFAVEASEDRAEASDPRTPWYRALQGRDLTPGSIPRTPLGRALTNRATRVLEAVRLAPAGTSLVSDFLNAGADRLVEGGETGIFTPMFYVLARRR